MALVHIQWHPTDRQLRQFGIAAWIALPVIGWFWGASWLVVGALALAGAVLAAVGAVQPRWLKPLFLGLSIITAPIGLVVGELAMLVMYFGILSPLALLMRCVRSDPLQRKLEPEASTYWEPHAGPPPPARYYRQS